ncbi:GNA1162 family protein [Desulfococcus sp.]|uniref:GNA1162 family protein n=1 Tax=Desulfococcus sp. TaxID=2025834 RepID=UPI00359347CC
MLLLAAFGVLFSHGGCAQDPERAPNALHPNRQGDYPRSVAVLPFTDLTGTPGLAESMRIEFYGHMSVLPFDDMELYVIDETLRRHRMGDPKVISRTPVKALGRVLGCDAVVFGNVYEFQKIYAGLYSSMNIGLSLQIWDARTAEIIWTDRYTARIHDGGLPLTFFDVPMITLRSGLNLRDTVKLHAIDEACRYLVHRIPTPRSVIRNPSTAYILQVGAFSSRDRAAAVEGRFRQDGFPAFIRKSRDERGVWHRVFLGPYRSMASALEIQQKLRESYRTESLISRNRS